jgi:predicted SprT family Zn-dependent metalloprotease
MQAEALQIKARCGEVVEKIKALYGMDLSQVRISFDLRGRAAGKAGGRGYRLPGHNYYVKFNRDMLTREAFEHVIQDTVPHEYAHVVCYMDPGKGKNHDYGWARVCRELGGSGARTHDEEVVYGKGITYEYTTDRGHKVRLSDKRHRYVQAGGTLRYKHGKGAVSQLCAHSVVGVRGQTLAAPIVRQAPNHPAVIEAAVRAPFVPPAPTWVAPVPTLVLRGFGTAPAPARVSQHTAGESKAAVSRRIMLSGHQSGQSYEQIIQAMMFANGYDRQLARATYKANAAKVGVPQEGA